jgi:membrane protease YdiL (CAAX protease family)
MNEPPDYSPYNLDTLYDILSHIDKRQYPERVEALVRRIRALEKCASPLQSAGKRFRRLRYALLSEGERNALAKDPFANLKRVPWTIPHLLVGTGVPISLFCVDRGLLYFNFYRTLQGVPWVLVSIVVLINALLYGFFALFPSLICLKRGTWPLFSALSLSLSRIFAEFFRSIPLYLAFVFSAGIIISLVGSLLDAPMRTPEVMKWTAHAPKSAVLIACLVLGFTLLPLIEEIFFRGFLYNGLKSRFPVPLAAALQAMVFAAFHPYDWMNRLYIFLLGIALAIAYERRGNLLSPIYIHSMVNLMATIHVLL